MKRNSATIFGALCVAGAVLISAYLFHARKRALPSAPDASISTPLPASLPATDSTAAPPTEPRDDAAAETTPPPRHRHRLQKIATRIFRQTASIRTTARWVDTAHAGERHFVEALQCEVVYVSGGRGICLSADRGVFTTYEANYSTRARLPSPAASRSRVFPAVRAFPSMGRWRRSRSSPSGHGYTTLDFDADAAHRHADGERARGSRIVRGPQGWRGGISNADFNFWGVTFTADARSSTPLRCRPAGKHYLVRGKCRRRAHRRGVIHENVECPSLSPGRTPRRIQKASPGRQSHSVAAVSSSISPAAARSRFGKSAALDDQLEWAERPDWCCTRCRARKTIRARARMSGWHPWMRNTRRSGSRATRSSPASARCASFSPQRALTGTSSVSRDRQRVGTRVAGRIARRHRQQIRARQQRYAACRPASVVPLALPLRRHGCWSS